MTQYTQEASELWNKIIDIYDEAVANHWRGMPNHERQRLIRIKNKAYRRTLRRMNKFGWSG